MPNGQLLGCLLLAVALALACREPVGLSPTPAPTVQAPSGTPVATSAAIDCGFFDGGHDGYDTRGFECVWNAYVARTPFRYRIQFLTIEGDPIPSTLVFDASQGLLVTRDVTADKFSNAASRRVWSWRCATMTKRPWVTDPSRYYLELSVCTGDGPTTAFP